MAACPDCAQVGASRYCLNCGRELDRRPSSLTDRAERHIRRLERAGLPTKGHGPACIVRTTGGWSAPDERPTHTRQDCPCCRQSEYRGSYCSGCGIPTGAADWHPAIRSESQQEAAAALGAASQDLAASRENGPPRHAKPERVTSSTQPAFAL